MVESLSCPEDAVEELRRPEHVIPDALSNVYLLAGGSPPPSSKICARTAIAGVAANFFWKKSLQTPMGYLWFSIFPRGETRVGV